MGTFEVTTDVVPKETMTTTRTQKRTMICITTVEFKENSDSITKITVKLEDKKLIINVRVCLHNIVVVVVPIAMD